MTPPGMIGTHDMNADGFYDYNTMRRWSISIDENKLLMMTIYYIDIEYSKNCISDFLLVIIITFPPYTVGTYISGERYTDQVWFILLCFIFSFYARFTL